jgi:hypothetical protein
VSRIRRPVDSIAGAAVLDCGLAHVKTVRETGGMLLGHGEPPFVAAADPDLQVWGYKTIEGLAHEHFGRHFPPTPARVTERPAGVAR